MKSSALCVQTEARSLNCLVVELLTAPMLLAAVLLHRAADVAQSVLLIALLLNIALLIRHFTAGDWRKGAHCKEVQIFPIATGRRGVFVCRCRQCHRHLEIRLPSPKSLHA